MRSELAWTVRDEKFKEREQRGRGGELFVATLKLWIGPNVNVHQAWLLKVGKKCQRIKRIPLIPALFSKQLPSPTLANAVRGTKPHHNHKSAGCEAPTMLTAACPSEDPPSGRPCDGSVLQTGGSPIPKSVQHMPSLACRHSSWQTRPKLPTPPWRRRITLPQADRGFSAQTVAREGSESAGRRGPFPFSF